MQRDELDMSILNFSNMTFPAIFKKKETLCYPFVKKEEYSGLKGQISIDESECILCSRCAKVCPAEAIVVSKNDRTWQINHYRCVTCFSCVRECPKTCLTMETQRPSVTRAIELDIHDIPNND